MSRIFKDEIDNILEDVRFTDDLKKRIEREVYCEKKSAIRPNIFKVAVCICAVFAISACVIGATSIFDRVKDKLGDTYETGILKAFPSLENTEVSGIKVDVAAAMTDGNSAVAYIVMEDKLKEGRIDDTAEIRELYLNLVEGNDSMGYSVDSVGYDNNGESVIMKISIDGKNLENKDITLNANDIMSNLEKSDGKGKGFNMFGIINKDATVISADKVVYDTDGEKFPQYMLKPDETSIPINDDGSILISNCGIINNNIHLQFKYKGEVSQQARMFFRFNDGEKDFFEMPIVYREFSTSEKGVVKTDDEESRNGWYYCETVFAVDEFSNSMKNLRNISVFPEYEYYRNVIKGSWNISFKVDKLENVFTGSCDFKMGDGRITSYALSPIGITFRGYSEKGNMRLYDIDPKVVINGKEIDVYGSSSSEWSLDETGDMEENYALKYNFVEPIDVSNAEKIIMGANEIILEKN